jgi:hypothetical protein
MTTKPPKMHPVEQQRAPTNFGKFFEQEFRQHPLVIGLSLIIGGFAVGFGAQSALSAVCACSESQSATMSCEAPSSPRHAAVR